jgi:hypothetical protein
MGFRRASIQTSDSGSVRIAPLGSRKVLDLPNGSTSGSSSPSPSGSFSQNASPSAEQRSFSLSTAEDGNKSSVAGPRSKTMPEMPQKSTFTTRTIL